MGLNDSQKQQPLFCVLVIVGGLFTVQARLVTAQSNIVPDQSLGAESSQVIPNVYGSTNEEIQGGARRGVNLFHSFREFNIDDGRGAYFANPAGVNNIFSRVTGNNLSNINGTLGVLGNANLFLVNPNGIFFGSNASLDIKGSFLGTTADAIQFGNQGSFRATESAKPTSLTVQPSALLFNQINNTKIENQSITGLKVLGGRSLSLVGGDVVIDGGLLDAFGGRIELGGVTTPGAIVLSTEGNLFRLSFPEEATLADVSLDNGARVDVSADGRGSIAVHADRVNISGQSDVLAKIDKNLGEVKNQTLEAAIKIQVNSLEIRDGSVLDASNFELGRARDIKIDARDQILLDGQSSNGRSSKILNRIERLSSGEGGNIELSTNSLEIKSGAFVSTSNLGNGNKRSGDITIKALDEVSLVGVGPKDGFPSGIYSQVLEGAEGDAGNLSLTVNEGFLSVIEGAELNATTKGQGNAGNIDIDVRNTILLDGESLPRKSEPKINSSGVFSRVEELGKGNAGSIKLSTNSLIIQNGAFISTNTESRAQGNTGPITVLARDNVSLIGVGTDTPSGILSQLLGNADATIGNVDGITVTVTKGSLSIAKGAEINTTTKTIGDAKDIKIDVYDEIFLNGEGPVQTPDGSIRINSSGIFSRIEPGGAGKGGDIEVSAASLNVDNGAFISTSNDSNIQGDAGNIAIRVRENVSLHGVGDVPSGVSSQVLTDAKGNAGNINVTLREGSLSVTEGAEINTTVLRNAAGDAGTISINAPEKIVLSGVGTVGETINSSGIFSGIRRDAQGNAGSILLSTSSLLSQNGAYISTSSGGQGNAGIVVVNAQNSIFLKGFGADGFPSGIYSQTQSRDGQVGNGQAGNIRLNVPTGLISVSDEALVSTKTSQNGKAGNITLTAKKLEVINGGQFVTNTVGNGNAGSINLNISDNILLTGIAPTYIERRNQSDDNVSGIGPESGLFANTSGDATGDSGSILSDLQTVQIIIQDSAKIAVDNQGIGIGGNISLKTGSLTLNEGTLSAETASNLGGNITLDIANLLSLQSNSLISATAGKSQADGNGGDIDIDTALLVAFPFENSDITANAFEGNGGNIQITAQGIFGTQFRNQLTPSSDITASSNFGTDGTVQLDTSLDPTSGLVDLPVQPPQPQQVAQTCSPNGTNAQSEFVYTGRGGLPPTTQQVLNQKNIDVGWVSLNSDIKSEHHSQSTPAPKPKSQGASIQTPETHQIVEAQGWTSTHDGKVMLTASNASAPQKLSQQVCPSN